MEDPTKEQVEEAKRVLWRSYYADVGRLYANLVERVFSGDIVDREGLQEAVDQDTDSSMTYTSDQHLALFASENSDDGFNEMVGMGVELNHRSAVNEILGPWSVLTLRLDVNEMLGRNSDLDSVFDGPDNEGPMSDLQRLVWLAHRDGRPIALLPDGRSAYFVGTVGAGQRDEVDFGVVLLGRSSEVQKGLVASLTSLRSFLRDVLPDMRPAQFDEWLKIQSDRLIELGLPAAEELFRGADKAGNVSVRQLLAAAHAWNEGMPVEATYEVYERDAPAHEDRDLDYTTVGLAELLHDNLYDDDLVTEVLGLSAGEQTDVGGGAAPGMIIRRVA